MLASPDEGRMKRELAMLVGFRTENPPGRELEAAEFLAGLLEQDGFEVSLDEYKPGRANVVAKLENGSGPFFALNTHMDVVPAADGWSSDPFALREDAGRLYGRGACDAKGSLIAMIEALRLLKADRTRWRGTLLGVFVADEEAASEGAKHFAAAHPRIDYAVIGEPTSNETVIAHKGSLRPWVRVHGASTHSGTPERGRNAIYDAAHIIEAVAAHHRDVVSLRKHLLVGQASLTITRAAAGVADNIVPDRCDLLLDRRMIPGEDEVEVKREITRLLSAAAERLGIRAEVIGYKPTTGGSAETPPDHPIVAASIHASRRNGATGRTLGFEGACDLVHFHAVGARGTVIGPGSLTQAHKPDEFVPVNEFIAASRIYREIAMQLLRAS
jgi:acetylornithine deacetylase/succinyl-diaminopimelate desuccinylase family protein